MVIELETEHATQVWPVETKSAEGTWRDYCSSKARAGLKSDVSTGFAMTTPLVAGISIAAAAYAARTLVKQYIKFQSAPPTLRAYYKGGFLPEMTRREAAMILGLRETASEEKIKEAHRRIMIANHPDSGGSSYIATKVNEAKEMLLGKKGSSKVF